jgi:deoxyribodipyrimidine photolyase
MDEMKDVKEWAEHMPSEGENPEHTEQQRDKEGVEQKVSSSQAKEASAAAPPEAESDAAEENREFVEEAVSEYNKPAEDFAKKHEQ